MSDSLPLNSEPPLDEHQVADWLSRHPDFFTRHPGLLAGLRIPHETGSAVSLVERQVAVLRERGERSEQKLRELIQLARSNERLANRIHQFAIGLIQARTLEDVLDRARDSLHNDFDAERVILRLVDVDGSCRARDPETFVAGDDPGFVLFQEFFQRGRAQSGRLSTAQREYLFGGGQAEIGSVALVPVFCGEAARGVLALSSSDPNRFHPALGVLFLNHIGELLSSALQPYLG